MKDQFQINSKSGGTLVHAYTTRNLPFSNGRNRW